MDFPKKLQQKLEARKAANALRKLGAQNNLIDFSSNDYLGFSKNKTIFKNTHDFLMEHHIQQNGATGSRLLSGNHQLFNITENMLCNFHNSETALVFNSGYDANVGFFSCVPQKDDIILYDEYIHASIRDGITMSHAKSYKFIHNDIEDLNKKVLRLAQHNKQTVYIVTESVFSMDGDTPNLTAMAQLSQKYNAFLIVDEAHALGTFGNRGVGLIQDLKLESQVFARLITFGKALGCHGAAILGSNSLKQYLINFSRSFIYTTALPPHSLATINTAYNELISTQNRALLKKNISHFKSEIIKNSLQQLFIISDSPIQCCIVSGNERVKSIAKKLQELNFNVKPILSPTVPKGHERLRFCLHSYNSTKEISDVLQQLATFATTMTC
ncbi:aminotransferase class I/II-fold pyridoxal phosphate-dependent enzyme [Snuella sedimenti]|uniref:Pyridoxal phosphate-dependent aminotransferase family protein n=1 Tax=Snuella sedimenti TaxID=2798802 RepID=A0A8J7IZF9_9FLAO|nr:pyridoxal phosphate-dependent aminotransferase family protein [Snuella sedimenti]MBJ6369500.1 pyridoxal phosphate-dependent aminotransferase family protein [Snuella sedimenti]